MEHVYFITGAGTTKVGFSTDVRSRLASLQRLVPVDLRVTHATPGGRALESALHRALTAQGRHVFREWFTAVSTADAKEAVRAARQVEADSTPEGFRRLRELGNAYVVRALELPVRSPGRGDLLDDALDVARRLERTAGPKTASEALHADILAARFGFQPPPHADDGYALPAEPPTTAASAPGPLEAFQPLIDL